MVDAEVIKRGTEIFNFNASGLYFSRSMRQMAAPRVENSKEQQWRHIKDEGGEKQESDLPRNIKHVQGVNLMPGER